MSDLHRMIQEEAVKDPLKKKVVVLPVPSNSKFKTPPPPPPLIQVEKKSVPVPVIPADLPPTPVMRQLVVPVLKETQVMIEVYVDLIGSYSIKGIHSFEAVHLIQENMHVSTKNLGSHEVVAKVNNREWARAAADKIFAKRREEYQKELAKDKSSPERFFSGLDMANREAYNRLGLCFGIIVSSKNRTGNEGDFEGDSSDGFNPTTYKSLEGHWLYFWVPSDTPLNLDFSLFSL